MDHSVSALTLSFTSKFIFVLLHCFPTWLVVPVRSSFAFITSIGMIWQWKYLYHLPALPKCYWRSYLYCNSHNIRHRCLAWKDENQDNDTHSWRESRRRGRPLPTPEAWPFPEAGYEWHPPYHVLGSDVLCINAKDRIRCIQYAVCRQDIPLFRTAWKVSCWNWDLITQNTSF